MKIDLSLEIADHFDRIKTLAETAESDPNESYSSRASAMTALTGIIRDLVKEQDKVINMERLMAIEATVIEVCNKHLSNEAREQFLNELEAKLKDNSQ